MARILVIDDDTSLAALLEQIIIQLGHEGETASTMADGLAKNKARDFDLVILDLNLPDGNGLDLLPRLQDSPSAPEIVILTGTGNHQGAELAFSFGAWDFLPKPFDIREISLTMVRALQYRAEKQAQAKPRILKRSGIIGRSLQIEHSLEFAARAAAGQAPVLITGETGTGKELFARVIHENSARAKGRFVIVDCTVLPEHLVESMLFGYERGAFTGADRTREGLIRQSHGGTLFLDEVGELPLVVQKSFLRVLQEKRFRPLGGQAEVVSDFRLVAATNRDLDQMVLEKNFRRDLLFRLKSMELHLPPLRERPGDTRVLTHHFLTVLAESDPGIKGLSPEFMTSLEGYSWPGNVRELFNTLEGILAAAGSDPTLHPKHLPPHLRLSHLARPPKPTGSSLPEDPAPGSNDPFPSFRDYRESILAQAEKEYIIQLMTKARGSKEVATRLSGLSEARLYALLKKYDLPRFKSSCGKLAGPWESPWKL